MAQSAAGLNVRITEKDALEGVRKALEGGKSGRGQIRLILDIRSTQSVEVALPGRYAISAELRAAIGALPGVQDLHDT